MRGQWLPPYGRRCPGVAGGEKPGEETLPLRWRGAEVEKRRSEEKQVEEQEIKGPAQDPCPEAKPRPGTFARVV